MQIRLALIMSMTVVEFNVFQLPFTLLVLSVLFETITGRLTIANEFATLSFACLWIDSIINPLWTSFISKKVEKNKVNNVSSALSMKGSKGLGSFGTQIIGNRLSLTGNCT